MVPEELILVRKGKDAHTVHFHVKGRLCHTGQQYDESFLEHIKEQHAGISSARYPDQCAITITLFRAYTDDWPEIEQIVFDAVSRRLGWVFERVVIRRQDNEGTPIDEGTDEVFQIASEEPCKQLLEQFVSDVQHDANNTPPD